MHKNGKTAKTVEIVRKPIVPGSWHGRDARKMALKRFFAFLGITLIYLIAGTFFSFDALWARILSTVVIVGCLAYYQYAVGAAKGEKDASYGEIIYSRRESGHAVDADRSFHRGKGFFAALVGCAPYVLFALAFALIAQKTTYRLGALPAWTESMMHQTEFSAGLAYYGNQPGMSVVDVMRVIDRAMIFPFIGIVSPMGAEAALWMERLSPILVLVVPVWYGAGYAQGLNYRARVNTGIKMGDEKKKRRESKARRQRQRSKTPERLI